MLFVIVVVMVDLLMFVYLQTKGCHFQKRILIFRGIFCHAHKYRHMSTCTPALTPPLSPVPPLT